MLERCQLEPLRPDQCQCQQPGTGTGNRPPPPTICTGTHPAQQIAPPVQTEGQSNSAPRAAALAFFFCAACRLPACRLPGLPDQQPGTRWALCRRCHDDHASTPPPQQTAPPTTCTGKDQHRQRRTDDPAAHQLHRLPIAHRQQPAAPDLTAASASRLHLPAAPAHPAALPPACRSGSAPPTTAKRPKTSPPRPAAGGVRFFT